jgi:hypothetical protein
MDFGFRIQPYFSSTGIEFCGCGPDHIAKVEGAPSVKGLPNSEISDDFLRDMLYGFEPKRLFWHLSTFHQNIIVLRGNVVWKYNPLHCMKAKILLCTRAPASALFLHTRDP